MGASTPAVYTPQERVVLWEMGFAGFSSREIADRLGWADALRVGNSQIVRNARAERAAILQARREAGRLQGTASAIERVSYMTSEGPVTLARVPGWSEGSDRAPGWPERDRRCECCGRRQRFACCEPSGDGRGPGGPFSRMHQTMGGLR